MNAQGVPHPGEYIRHDCLEPLGLSIAAGANALGVSRKHLSDIVNCKSGISPEMAIQLAKVFGGDARTWYRLQAEHDMERATEKSDEIELERLTVPV